MSSHNFVSCFFEGCQFHLILIETSLNQTFKRLDKYQYIYQETDTPYRLYKNKFFTSIVALSKEIVNQLTLGRKKQKRTKQCKETTGLEKIQETKF